MLSFKEFLKEEERKEYKALVKDRDTGHLSILTYKYRNLADFISDLKGNGYIVKRAALADTFDKVTNMDASEREQRKRERSDKIRATKDAKRSDKMANDIRNDIDWYKEHPSQLQFWLHSYPELKDKLKDIL